MLNFLKSASTKKKEDRRSASTPGTASPSPETIRRAKSRLASGLNVNRSLPVASDASPSEFMTALASISAVQNRNLLGLWNDVVEPTYREVVDGAVPTDEAGMLVVNIVAPDQVFPDMPFVDELMGRPPKTPSSSSSLDVGAGVGVDERKESEDVPPPPAAAAATTTEDSAPPPSSSAGAGGPAFLSTHTLVVHRFMLRSTLPTVYNPTTQSVTITLPCLWPVASEQSSPTAEMFAHVIVYALYNHFSFPVVDLARMQWLALMFYFDSSSPLLPRLGSHLVEEACAAFSTAGSSTDPGAGAGAGAGAGSGSAAATTAQFSSQVQAFLTGSATGDWLAISQLAEGGYLDGLPADITAAMEQASVHRELSLLSGRDCGACGGRMPRGQDECRIPECMATPVSDPPSLVRLPSDLPESFFLPPPAETEVLEILCEEQRAAMAHVVEQASKLSNEARPALLERVKSFGYTESEFRKCLRYIRDEAPLIIHFNPTKSLKFFVTDTHYRNQFETKTSGGSTNLRMRRDKEKAMFNNAYPEDVEDAKRTKYGVINITSDTCGIKSCSSYGNSYLSLKKVRLRCSFADRNSSSSSKLASVEHYIHVLAKFNDREIKAIMDVALGKKPYMPSSVLSNYKEIQIHGPIELSEHVQALVMHHSHRTNPEMVRLSEEFSAKHGVPVVWMAPQPGDTTTSRGASMRNRTTTVRQWREARAKAMLAAIKSSQKWTCVRCQTQSLVSTKQCSSCGLARSVRAPVVSTNTASLPAHLTALASSAAGAAVSSDVAGLPLGSGLPWTCLHCTSSVVASSASCTTCHEVSVWPCSCGITSPFPNETCVCGSPLQGTKDPWTCLHCTVGNAPFTTVCTVCGAKKGEAPPPAPVGPSAKWNCGTCTLENPPGVTMCVVCGAPAPTPSSSSSSGSASAPTATTPPPPPASSSVLPGSGLASGPSWDCGVCSFTNSNAAATSCELCLSPRSVPKQTPAPPAVGAAAATATAADVVAANRAAAFAATSATDVAASTAAPAPAPAPASAPVPAAAPPVGTVSSAIHLPSLPALRSSAVSSPSSGPAAASSGSAPSAAPAGATVPTLAVMGTGLASPPTPTTTPKH